MQLDAVPTINDIRSDELLHKTVIVIDVLRATSCIVTALAHGCDGIVPVETVTQAVNMHEKDDLLGGERLCKKISGFDLGNSPLEYTRADLAGKKIILTTTNGTRAIQKSHRAQHILCGSFLNARACAETAIRLQRDVVLICAGTRDRFSLEDSLCAGRIVEEIFQMLPDRPACNDFAVAMHAAYSQLSDRLEQTLFMSENGLKLTKLGYGDDVSFCAQINRYETVPAMQDHILRHERFSSQTF